MYTFYLSDNETAITMVRHGYLLLRRHSSFFLVFFSLSLSLSLYNSFQNEGEKKKRKTR